MKKLNKWQNLVFQVGGLLVVAGAALPLFGQSRLGALVLAVGALMFSTMQTLTRYEGTNTIVQRLRKQQLLGALLLIAAGVLAMLHQMGMYHLGSGEWKICLAVSAVMELYTAFRLPTALRDAGEDAD